MAQVFKADPDKERTLSVSRRSPATADQVEARKELTAARVRTKARKLDTRRKIVLGGGLIALARNGDTAAQQLIQKIIEHHDTERHQSPFDGWSPSHQGDT